MSNLKEKLILKRLEKVYCRLAPSPIHGIGVFAIKDIPKGTNPFGGSFMAQEAIIVNKSKINDPEILSLLHDIAEKYDVVSLGWNGFNVLHNHAAMVGGLDLGFYSDRSTADILKATQEGKINVLYLLAADEIDINEIGEDCFVIYQGHHGDSSANRADVILPEAAYTEQDGIFVNMEGRPQYARAAISPPGQARESWDIITYLAKRLDVPMQAGSLAAVRDIMAKENMVFANIDEIIPTNFVPFKSPAKLSQKTLQKVEMNYYMTDSISRASVTMARCAKMQLESEASS